MIETGVSGPRGNTRKSDLRFGHSQKTTQQEGEFFMKKAIIIAGSAIAVCTAIAAGIFFFLKRKGAYLELAQAPKPTIRPDAPVYTR